MKLKIGNLKHQMEIQRQANGRTNNYGEKTEVSESVGDAWFGIETLTQNESVKASTVERIATHRLRCYYDPTICFDSSYTLVMNLRRFNVISAIDVDEKHQEWEIIASVTNG